MWFVLMGVESFKDIYFVSEPIGEVGVIVYIKEPLVMAAMAMPIAIPIAIAITMAFNCTH